MSVQVKFKTLLPSQSTTNTLVSDFFRTLLASGLGFCCLGICFSTQVFAWGHDGHGVVGILAIEQMQPEARLRLKGIIGNIEDQTVIEACNWPDAARDTEEWAWTEPMHYINIPQGETSYSKSRDCADQRCATEAIKTYARELGNQRLLRDQRSRAFAWLCHFAGDLHQPLHAGYAFDRGGNDFDITFQDEQINLHGFWDTTLIKTHANDWQKLLALLGSYPVVQTAEGWQADMVNNWTEESHQLVMEELYPENPVITDDYAQKSWAIMQQRMTTAAARLAMIINTVLSKDEL